MLYHEGLAEGLPFHLDFVVRNKKAQYKCPHCGSVNTARYLYGMLAFSEEMQAKLDADKWVLGGCCISSVEINGQSVDTMPARRCNDCKKDFASAPILVNQKAETFEDYRDIVTAVKFSVGGYFGGYTEITIRKNDKGAVVKVQKTLDYEDLPARSRLRRRSGRRLSTHCMASCICMSGRKTMWTLMCWMVHSGAWMSA